MSMDPKLTRRFARLETLLADKFGARRGRLDRRVIKAGRRLPRSVRKDLGQVAKAQGMAGHPKLARMIDTPRTERAAERAESWLDAVDLADRRRGQVLGLLGVLSFNLIALFVLGLIVLRWRGFI